MRTLLHLRFLFWADTQVRPYEFLGGHRGLPLQFFIPEPRTLAPYFSLLFSTCTRQVLPQKAPAGEQASFKSVLAHPPRSTPFSSG